MVTMHSVLLICALVCFLLGSIGIPWRVNVISLGLFFLTMVLFFK